MPDHRNQYHLFYSNFVKEILTMSTRIQSEKGHDLYAFNTALKRNLKNAIYNSKSNLRETADFLGVKYAVLSQMLNEDRRTYVLCIDFAYLICKHLGITLADVIPLTEESKSLVLHKTIDGERVKELQHKLDLIRSVIDSK